MKLGEIHDHPRFPTFLRDLVTDALESLWAFGNTYRSILPKMECAAQIVPVEVRQTGTRGAEDGARQEAQCRTGCEPSEADRSSRGERKDDAPSMQGSRNRGADLFPLT